MKKVALLLIAAFTIVLVSSCGSSKECPAYGQVQQTAEQVAIS